ncbi:MAG: tetratricopeptide repeat protein [Myxococcota bacterium]
MVFAWLRRRRQRRTLDAAAQRLTDALRAEVWARAVDAGREAVTAAEVLFGPEHPEVVAPRYALAAAHLGGGDLDLAAAESERALALATAHPLGVVPPLPQLYEQRLAIAERNGDDEVVDRILNTLIRAYDRMRAPEPDALASALHRRALHLAHTGRRAQAAGSFSQALTALERAPKPSTLSRAEVLYNRASLAPEETPAQSRLADFADALAASPPAALRARIEHNRGTILEEVLGDRPAALAAYTAALSCWPEAAEARPTWVRLARLHHAEGRFERAIEHYEKARRLAAAAHAHEVVTRIETWIGDAHAQTYR